VVRLIAPSGNIPRRVRRRSITRSISRLHRVGCSHAARKSPSGRITSPLEPTRDCRCPRLDRGSRRWLPARAYGGDRLHRARHPPLGENLRLHRRSNNRITFLRRAVNSSPTFSQSRHHLRAGSPVDRLLIKRRIRLALHMRAAPVCRSQRLPALPRTALRPRRTRGMRASMRGDLPRRGPVWLPPPLAGSGGRPKCFYRAYPPSLPRKGRTDVARHRNCNSQLLPIPPRMASPEFWRAAASRGGARRDRVAGGFSCPTPSLYAECWRALVQRDAFSVGPALARLGQKRCCLRRATESFARSASSLVSHHGAHLAPGARRVRRAQPSPAEFRARAPGRKDRTRGWDVRDKTLAARNVSAVTPAGMAGPAIRPPAFRSQAKAGVTGVRLPRAAQTISPGRASASRRADGGRHHRRVSARRPLRMDSGRTSSAVSTAASRDMISALIVASASF